MEVKYIFAKKYVDVVPVLEKSLPLLQGSIGVITTIQYLHLMKDVKAFFEKKDMKADILGQVLGCNTKVVDASKADTILYFGDGLFHPKAMTIRDEKKRVILANPLTMEVREMTKEEMETFENRAYAALAKFYSSQDVGVLVTMKPGQEQMEAALSLKKKYPEKNFYVLVFDDLNWGGLEDFPFIECFVNTMCPRIAYDDYNKLPRPVIDYLDLEKKDGERVDRNKKLLAVVD